MCTDIKLEGIFFLGKLNIGFIQDFITNLGMVDKIYLLIKPIFYLEDKELPEEEVAPGDPDLDDRLPDPVPVGSDSGRLSLQVDKPPSKIRKNILFNMPFNLFC